MSEKVIEVLVALQDAYLRTASCLRLWPNDPSLEEDLKRIQEISLDIRMLSDIGDARLLEAIEEAEEIFCLVK